MRKITEEAIRSFSNNMLFEEKAEATVRKYTHDVGELRKWLGECELSKKTVLSYKAYLTEHYAPASVNAALSSLNSFFDYMEWYELRVKSLKIQKQIFAREDKELTVAEYDRLLRAAKEKKNERLFLLMQAICSTGIRVSELRYITVEAVSRGTARIRSKGKIREILLPKQLCIRLRCYAKEQKIKSGAVFVTKRGNPLDRSNIWNDMKKLCRAAGVSETKVFPHNLRHLFARTYYNLEKDIVRLSDILGHSNVNTTRIYTMQTCGIYRKQLQRLGLLRC